MSLEKFYHTIEKSAIGKFFENRLNALKDTDPNRIYVENVRSFYNVPTWVAKFFCELAVKEGIFQRRIGIWCPHQHGMIKSVANETDLPDQIVCETCLHLEMAKSEYSKSEFKTKTYYQSQL